MSFNCVCTATVFGQRFSTVPFKPIMHQPQLVSCSPSLEIGSFSRSIVSSGSRSIISNDPPNSGSRLLHRIVGDPFNIFKHQQVYVWSVFVVGNEHIRVNIGGLYPPDSCKSTSFPPQKKHIFLHDPWFLLFSTQSHMILPKISKHQGEPLCIQKNPWIRMVQFSTKWRHARPFSATRVGFRWLLLRKKSQPGQCHLIIFLQIYIYIYTSNIYIYIYIYNSSNHLYTYSWWFRNSKQPPEIDLKKKNAVYDCRFSISTGAGFLPSTVMDYKLSKQQKENMMFLVICFGGRWKTTCNLKNPKQRS